MIPEIIKGDGPLVILCDHASNHIPPELDADGFDPALLDQHIAYDIGAAGVTRRLADRLTAHAVLARVSRLVCDLNRNPDTQDPMPVVSDGVPIPFNQGLVGPARTARLDAYFHPFHEHVDAYLDGLLAAHAHPVIFAMHSFTPVMDGVERPWEIGFLYDRDDRLFRAFRDVLSARHDFHIGDNEPYSGRALYYSMDRHGQARGIPQLVVEVRQDLIADEAGQDRWADILAQAVHDMADHPALQERFDGW